MTTTPFRVSAIPATDLARIRSAGVDDHGHPLREFTADHEPGTPLRCCLREARIGERVALIAHQPLVEALDSPYAEIGPVFVHAEECGGYVDVEDYPEGFRPRRQVFRSYSAAGDMLAAEITEGADAEETLARLFGDDRAAVVHSRNVAPGCFMFAVRRA